jgi:hypothetical protein
VKGDVIHTDPFILFFFIMTNDNMNSSSHGTHIAAQNVHCLSHKVGIVASINAMVTGLTETDFPEYKKNAIKTQFESYGKNIMFGESLKYGEKIIKRGPRVALVCASPIIPTKLPIDPDDETTQFLRYSGRWLEACIPVDNGDRHIMVAVFYGISGANGCKKAYQE